jgi:hypothetical protein
MSIYRTGEIHNRLTVAQMVIDKHVAADAGGRCLTCGEVEPCEARRAAHLVFTTYGRLPHRRVGAAMPWFLRNEAS